MASTPAAAHNPRNCFHGHQTEGSWHAHFDNHGWIGNIHVNIYDHYLISFGQHVLQHENIAVICGS